MTEAVPISGRDNPFAVLGIPATLDLGLVKRGWFRALSRHPPHQDPEGFRRLRAAYEELVRPGGLEIAFAASPIDSAAMLADWNQRFDAAIARHAEDVRRAETDAALIARFVDATSRMSFAEALAAFTQPDSP